MSDLISRQAALDALGEAPEVWMDTPEEFAELNQWEYDVAAIKAVPSADRPIGEWIDNGDRYYRCSLCGARDTDTWDWCHGCGCRMKGVDDERIHREAENTELL